MDIIFDTNILRKDLKLKGNQFDIVLDYLKRTDSHIVLPTIVYDEAKGLYRRLLNDRIEEYGKIREKLASITIETPIDESVNVDIEREVILYGELIHKRLKLKSGQIIGFKNEYLPELVARAIQRRKPLDGTGQQFRDGLLWLTILDYASQCPERRLIFISENHSDFSEQSGNNLHKELNDESEARGLTIIYYKSVTDFIKEHAAKVDFITEEWIEKNVAFNKLEEIFNDEISQADRMVLDQVRDSLERHERVTGHIKSTGYIQSRLRDYYVYEMSDGSLVLHLEVELEKEYEVEIEREFEREDLEYEYESTVDPLTGELEWERNIVPRIQQKIDFQYKYEYPVFIGKFDITVKDGIIVHYEFKDWDGG